MLNLIRKKYFLLTAILLVGVVLLSGCLGGSSGSDTIDDLEGEAVIQSAFSELEKQNFTEAESYFSDDFKLESYNYSETLDEFLNIFENKIVYEDEFTREEYKITNINITNLTQVSSSASEKTFKAKLEIKQTWIYTYLDDNTEEKETDEFSEEMLLTINNNNKISSVKEIYPEEELIMLESLVETIETENKVNFESYFAENNSILNYSGSEPTEFNNPAELYDFILNNYQNKNIDFYYYYFESIDSNNVLINFELELFDKEDYYTTIDIDAKIEYNNGDLKITSLEIYDIW